MASKGNKAAKGNAQSNAQGNEAKDKEAKDKEAKDKEKQDKAFKLVSKMNKNKVHKTKTLIGKRRKTQVFELTHSAYCTEAECFCKEGSVTINKASKKHANMRSLVKLPRKFPAILVIRYGENKVVRDAVLQCPGIVEAIRKGHLGVR